MLTRIIIIIVKKHCIGILLKKMYFEGYFVTTTFITKNASIKQKKPLLL